MSDQQRCQATTKAGTQCKNTAQEGSNYCHIHQDWAEEVAPETPDTAPVPAAQTSTAPTASPAPKAKEDESLSLDDAQRAEFKQIAAELNELAESLRKETKYAAPSFSLEQMVALVQQNIHRFTPQAQREIVQTLRSNFAGTKPKDLVDPETWKGFWYVFNYMAQNQRKEATERVNKQLEKVPGFALLSDLSAGLKDAKPQDLVDPETWKGLAFVTEQTVRSQVTRFKDFILGGTSE